ncbi:PilY2 family type 4a fimbrial biogenesis protein [Pseudomonas nitroreducens]|uniref:PilY2 family type 4a fimbrial biogenesis protein n=1 Tax=Pseudomonas nitroreducens TaxID=46680 RepID=UPI0037F6BB84
MTRTVITLALAALLSSAAGGARADVIESNGPVTLIDLKESRIRVNEVDYLLPNRVQVGSMPAIYQIREGSVISFLAQSGAPYPTITSIGMLYQPPIQNTTNSATPNEQQ